MERLQQFLDFMKPHWSYLALVGTWAGIGLVALRRRAAWKRKQFDTQVNFSINYRAGSTLVMRTLLERSAIEVWPNEHGARQVFQAARRTTEDDPFIALADPHDQDFVNRAVLNVLSERFGEAFLGAALGLPVHASTFRFAVTYERASIMRTLKLRVLLVEERTLEELFGPAGQAKLLHVNNAIYRKRLQTLEALHARIAADAARPTPVVGRVELGVLVTGRPTISDGPAAHSSGDAQA